MDLELWLDTRWSPRHSGAVNALCPAGRNLRHTSTTNSYIPIPANKNCYKFLIHSAHNTRMESTANSIAAIQDKTVFKTAAHNHLIKQSNQKLVLFSLRQ